MSLYNEGIYREIKLNSEELLNLIKNSKRRSPAKAYLKLSREIEAKGCDIYGSPLSPILFGDLADVLKAIDSNADAIIAKHIELEAKNQALELLDITNINARIEPGAIIRAYTSIADDAIIMMGAIINAGARIGNKTMIDMGAVVGSNAVVGANCHIGAGAVISGVLEPPSAKPTVIEDNVLIGANAVILEGVRIGCGAIVGAGAIVTKDIDSMMVAYGNPARVIRSVDDRVKEKTRISLDLRGLEEVKE